jgi:hypothetical protein
MDSSVEEKIGFISQNKLLLLLVLTGLLLVCAFGGYYLGVHNQQAQPKQEVEDLPAFLVKIDTREHFYLLTLIEKQKIDKATEYLFLRIMGNLQAVNDIDRRKTGPKFSVDDHKELCDLLTPLQSLGKSEFIATVPDRALIPNFQAEVSALAQSCARTSGSGLSK